jgi:hypothetical protein
MTDTPHLGLPLIAASQSQKHVTHNQAIVILDAIVMLSVVDSTHTAPPGSPAEGDRYKVASGATGAWATWDLNIALYTNGQWVKLVPKKGWLCFDEATGALTVWTGSDWTDLAAAGGYLTIAAAGNGTLARLGILTAADDTNRLAVKSDAVLLSHDDVTPGTGDLRVTLNKSAVAKDAGFTLQDAFSTRALFGLLGDDDFTVKVSPDGSTFYLAVSIDKDTGHDAQPADAWCRHRMQRTFVGMIHWQAATPEQPGHRQPADGKSRKRRQPVHAEAATVAVNPASIENGGVQPRRERMAELSTKSDPVSRVTAARLPSSAPANSSKPVGTASKRAGRPMARAIARINSGVETGSPSSSRKVCPAAAGCSVHTRIASTKLPRYKRLRRL